MHVKYYNKNHQKLNLTTCLTVKSSAFMHYHYDYRDCVSSVTGFDFNCVQHPVGKYIVHLPQTPKRKDLESCTKQGCERKVTIRSKSSLAVKIWTRCVWKLWSGTEHRKLNVCDAVSSINVENTTGRFSERKCSIKYETLLYRTLARPSHSSDIF